MNVLFYYKISYLLPELMNLLTDFNEILIMALIRTRECSRFGLIMALSKTRECPRFDLIMALSRTRECSRFGLIMALS